MSRWFGHRHAPLVAWVFMAVLVTVALAMYGSALREIAANQKQIAAATDERARLACDGARDTRQVVSDMLEFAGEQQLDPDDYTGELRAAVIKSTRRGQEFRDTTISKLEIPPPLCTIVNDEGGGN